MEIQDNMELLE